MIVGRRTALERALEGDIQARGEVLDGFRPYVRVLVRALRNGRLQSRLDDSDLIQDALLEAHRSFESFRGRTPAELAAWLRVVVLRTAGHVLRSHLDAGKRRSRSEETIDYFPELAHSGSSPSQQVMRHEEAARMAARIDRLPEDMQQVLLGRHMDQLSYAALAERLGRSEGAVRVLYTRALRRLRDECRDQ